MAVDRGRGGAGTYLRMAIDALAYAVVVTAGSLVLALVLGIAIGGSVVLAKLLLFLAGWLMLAVATFRLWPRSPESGGAPVTRPHPARRGGLERTRVEGVADAVPPLRGMRPPPRQFSPASKLFLASLVVLFTSLLLEVVLAVE